MSSNRKGRDIDAALRRKGFSRNKSGDHFRYVFAGMPCIRTMISHGVMGDSIGADLISRMSRQLHLSKEQFLYLIDCNIDADGYRAIILHLQQ
jgi:hypothetical protein